MALSCEEVVCYDCDGTGLEFDTFQPPVSEEKQRNDIFQRQYGYNRDRRPFIPGTTCPRCQGRKTRLEFFSITIRRSLMPDIHLVSVVYDAILKLANNGYRYTTIVIDPKLAPLLDAPYAPHLLTIKDRLLQIEHITGIVVQPVANPAGVEIR